MTHHIGAPPGPQTHEPRGGGLLHPQDPAPLSSTHQNRITARLTGEQGWHHVIGAGTGVAVSSGGAFTVRTLGADQQAGQQALDHTGQHPTRPQGRQHTRHIPHRHRLRARARSPGGRAHPTRHAAGRVTGKHTTIEHMYSIAPPTTTRTPNHPSKPPQSQRKRCIDRNRLECVVPGLS
ncbi:hypothetical protein [Actinomyces viscosus]|uniref:Uncharacterized protein n=1 Tax=Actinomyces viscosus TaxID=1656 RepID=A0A3S4Z0X1_ACTVI|nr:hypothetical protein [Actinomyces viscosus]VEI15033.1 Uncharacterised protein [Actinomyces viscosus]